MHAFPAPTSGLSSARKSSNHHTSTAVFAALSEPSASQVGVLLDQMQEALCVIDARYTVRYWNAALEKLSGVGRHEALNQPLFRLLPGNFKDALEDRISGAIASNEKQSGEIIFKYQKHDYFAFHFQISPFPFANGTPLWMLSFVDITDRYRLQFEKERQEHFATLSVLSVSVAQELASPLDEICRHVERILQDLNGLIGNSRLHNALNSIISQVYRISYLAHNLVALTQQSKPLFVSLKINDLMLDAIEQYEQEVGSRLIANLHFHEDLPFVVGDPMLMQSALQILLKIAVEFAGEDAVPRIRTQHDADSGRVIVLFENRGPIVPSDELEHLFEWYYGSTAISPGASLGLFISKKIIEAQKGHFKIISEEGKGTIFEVDLPALN
ncbi:MAG: PAS domain-containing protein [candidate division KSB1 bacterium]|nr:PAS domain-containing protein [candidate division KSB1 bacterium]